jgi:hypothetical protein
MTASSTAGIPFQVAAFADGDYPDDEWGLLPFPGPDGRLRRPIKRTKSLSTARLYAFLIAFYHNVE